MAAFGGDRELAIGAGFRFASICIVFWMVSTGGAAAQSSAEAGPPDDYVALSARSAALAPADRARAQALFGTSFSLWKSGDFDAAALGFKQGLQIDPANALANYYYGNCLARQKNKTEAKLHLSRAVAFGSTTAEGLKAQAELLALSLAPTNVSDMSEDEIRNAVLGKWHSHYTCPWGAGGHDTDILKIEGSVITKAKDFNWANSFKSGAINGTHIRLTHSRAELNGELVSPTRIEGTVTYHTGTCTWVAEK